MRDPRKLGSNFLRLVPTCPYLGRPEIPTSRTRLETRGSELARIYRWGSLVLLFYSWLYASLTCSTAQPLYSPQVLLQGRFSPGAAANGIAVLPQTFSWPSSSVYTSFEGATYVTVSLAALPPNTTISYGINWFRCYIDGQYAADGFTSYNKLDLTLTVNVTTSIHLLRIVKLDDGAKGEAVLQSIVLSSGGRFLNATLPADIASGKRMLVLGDSYAVGYGNAGAVLPGTCQPDVQQLPPEYTATCNALQIKAASECADLWQVFNENSLEAFGPVAAASLDADFQVIATSGSGMVGYSYAAEANPTLTPAEYERILPSNQALYNRSIFGDANSQYNLQSWEPQLVVVASGTNDWHSVPPLYTLDEWVANAVAFLQQISTTLNQPAIILQVFPAEQQLDGALSGEDGVNETMQYVEAMPSLYTAAVEQRVPNIHYLQLDTQGYDNISSWCDGHPSAVADRAIASQLVNFIAAAVPGWKISSPVSTAVDQIAIRPNVSMYTSTGAIISSSDTNEAG